MSDKGWGFKGSAAATVDDYTYSAASSIGNTAKNAWNSDAAANTTSVIKNTTAIAVSSIENAANVTSSAVKNGISSAGNGVKTWLNSESEKTGESSVDSARGVVVAMAKNASNYVVSTSGRASNIVNIHVKDNLSSLGNPRQWVRVDRPHGNVNYHHINMNKAVSGFKDPHIPISPATAKAAGALGKVAEIANNIAPMVKGVAIGYEAYRIGKEAKKDYENGTSRNTVKAVTTTASTYTSGYIGAKAGAIAGTALFPGLGTISGGIAGGVVGGYYGGYYGNVAWEKALDHIQWDHVTLECKACRKEYTWKKYEGVGGACCPSCGNKPIKSKL